MKFKSIAILAVASLSLAACSDTQLSKFQSGVANFTAGVAVVNQAIGDISPQLLKNCNSLQSFAGLLAPLASGKYGPDYQAAVATLNTYCTAPPVANISGVVSLTSQAYLNAKAAYEAAKKTGA